VYLTTDPPAKPFKEQPLFLTTTLGGVVGGEEHPQLPLFWGLYNPKDSPCPVPVTEEAAISTPKEGGPPCPNEPPCNIIYYCWRPIREASDEKLVLLLQDVQIAGERRLVRNVVPDDLPVFHVKSEVRMVRVEKKRLQPSQDRIDELRGSRQSHPVLVESISRMEFGDGRGVQRQVGAKRVPEFDHVLLLGDPRLSLGFVFYELSESHHGNLNLNSSPDMESMILERAIARFLTIEASSHPAYSEIMDLAAFIGFLEDAILFIFLE